jgi:CubicO group peptidase (beta-lactamase class C family)
MNKIRTLSVCVAASFIGVAANALAAQSSALPVAKPEAVGMSSQRLAQIAVAFQGEIDRKTMPGAVVAIARRGKLVYYEAFGKLSDDAPAPMPRDAIFPLYSMTKPLTAVGALQLVENTRLMLIEPIGTYLPQLDNMVVQTASGTEPARRKPTLQDMMRHTAGVTYGSADSSLATTELSKRYAELTHKLSAQEFLTKLGSLPLQFQPGTKWAYGLGLDVTGLAIEAVVKQRLGAYLQQSLFEPLGMTDTSFVVPTNKADRLAKPLDGDPTAVPGFDGGGGGAYSTAADYLRFAEMLRRGGSFEGVHILGRKTVEYMTSDQLGPEVDIAALRDWPNLTGGYGFGLSVAVRRGPGVAGIMGSTGDFNWGGAGGTYFWVDPKEELTAVLMARAGPARIHLRQLLSTLVYASLVN